MSQRTAFRDAPTPEARGTRTLTADMRADANHSGKFLRLFGGIWMGVSVLVAVLMALIGRGVQFRNQASFNGGGLAIGGLSLLAGAVVYLVGMWLRARTLAVFERGVEVRAIVTKVFLDYRVRMNKKNPWRVVYRYATPTGERTGTATYWTDDRPDAEVGDELTAVYLPESPGRTILWSRIAVGGSTRVARAAASTDTPDTANRLRLATGPTSERSESDTDDAGEANEDAVEEADADEAADREEEADAEQEAQAADAPAALRKDFSPRG